MRLRPPQAEALASVRDVLLRLPDRLSTCTPEEVRQFLTGSGWTHTSHPAFTLSLATGLGKSRLAGAIIALLWLSGEARTFVLLAPRRAVLRRLNDALDPAFHDYLFTDPNLIPEPLVIRADEITSPAALDPQAATFARGPRIYLLSPQLVTSSPIFNGRDDLSQISPAQVLKHQQDVVVIVDEAHHVGRLADRETTAWANAIRELEPRLQIGLTATPRQEAGVNLLYDYPLKLALAEGLYTKAVQLLVREFPGDDRDPWDIDQQTITFALDRLRTKEEAIALAAVPPFPEVKPVAVLFARDIEHAKQVYDWLLSSTLLTADEIHLTYSGKSKTEEEVEQLLRIESPSNPVRVVVNVMELTEGWDVRNVYVVAPLRAMATFQGAVQAMGRGLRLPAGRRIGEREADTLDVICFGKESLKKIADEATAFTGREPSPAAGIEVKDSGAAATVDVPVEVGVVREETIEFVDLRKQQQEPNLDLEPAALRRVTEMAVNRLELAQAQMRIATVKGQVALDRARFTEAVAMRVLRALPEYLADDIHRDPVRVIVQRWLDEARPKDRFVPFDPFEVGDEIARVIKQGLERESAQYIPASSKRRVAFPGFRLIANVPALLGVPRPTSLRVEELPTIGARDTFVRFQPCRGWRSALHDAYSFDSWPEAKLATLLDVADDVVWWVRNQPRRLQIATPAGVYNPDFVALLDTQPKRTLLILESKADDFWNPPESVPRLKARAAAAWCEAQPPELPTLWSYAVALESDIERVASWPELFARLLRTG